MPHPSPGSRPDRRLHRASALLVALLAAALLAAGVAEADKKVKEKPRKGQAGAAFTNDTGQAAHGLVVALSNDAEVMADPDTNRAGPFLDIKGNGTQKMVFSNPTQPVEPGSEPFELIFRSYKSDLKITRYWWLDERGKQLGKKKKP